MRRTVSSIVAPLAATGALFFLPAASAGADDRQRLPDQRCAEGSTVEIVQCLEGLTEDWDRRLNAAYRALMHDAPQGEELRAAQRLWIQFRDANCRYFAAGEGTITRIHAAECMRSTTAQRARELEDWLNGR